MALDGMGMLLKSLGINPEALQAGMQLAEGKISAIETALANIEKKLDRVCLALSVSTDPVELKELTNGRSDHQN